MCLLTRDYYFNKALYTAILHAHVLNYFLMETFIEYSIIITYLMNVANE